MVTSLRISDSPAMLPESTFSRGPYRLQCVPCFFKIKKDIIKNLFIYLPVLGLSCIMRDCQSLLRHAGSLVVACGI